MLAIAFDLETLGDTSHKAVLDMALHRDQSPSAFASLCPPLARVVCAGFQNIGDGRTAAIMDARLFPNAWPDDIPELGMEAHPGEAAVLQRINEILAKADRIVTFNGRGFDLPVLIHRMLARSIPPNGRIVAAARESRYYPKIHIDIAEEFSFHGAAPRHSLRTYSIGYGLEDPKATTDGEGIADLIAQGEPRALAEYCLGDVRSTAALYQRWADLVGSAA
jgi:DNA polymerase elongation subunit (family B)